MSDLYPNSIYIPYLQQLSDPKRMEASASMRILNFSIVAKTADNYNQWMLILDLK